MYIKITAKKWFQTSYGNTYHSCLVERISGEGTGYKSETIGYEPFTYGYGDQYIDTAAKILCISYQELQTDIRDHPGRYCIFATDVNRKKDL